MQYKIVVTAGPSLDESTHEIVHVNSGGSLRVNSEHFTGQVTVRVANFNGLAPHGTEPIPQSAYFEKVPDATWSIETTGQYLTEGLTSDDLLFGIVFRRSIVDRLPSTYHIGVRALQWFNPNIAFQLEGDAPTILAPLLAVASRARITPFPDSPLSQDVADQTEPPTPAPGTTPEDISHLIRSQSIGSRASGRRAGDKDLMNIMIPPANLPGTPSTRPATPEKSPSRPSSPVSQTTLQPTPSPWGWFRGWNIPKSASKARQQWMSNEDVRKETIIGTTNVVNTDISNGFIDFSDMTLRIPRMPFTVPLGDYMVGRPVQYCCVSRDLSKFYWCVVFTMMDDDVAESLAT